MSRVYLSPPHVGDEERRLLLEAFDSNWIAPLGPQVDAFEAEMAEVVGVPHCVALASGTAALHLAMLVLGVEAGDEVYTSTLTFAATANAIRYVGARPVFIDSERSSWNLDPDLLDDALSKAAEWGRLPAAVLVVDLYGQCADYDRILELCQQYEVPLVEDAAEALGASYRGKAAGQFGDLAALSFNGNKIITTSGGGMLLSPRRDFVERARHLATQAREPAPWYQHSVVGYNYRLSNLLAAVGRAQLRKLESRVRARRSLNAAYRERLADLPGLSFMPEIEGGRSTFWLTCLTVDPAQLGVSRDDLISALERENIEARPVWKPMHQQPVFAAHRAVGGAVAAELFETGLCLPSGSSLSERDRDRVIAAIRGACAAITGGG